MLIKFADVTNLDAVAHTRRLRINTNGSNEIINTRRKEENQIPFRKVQIISLGGGNPKHVHSAGLKRNLGSNHFKQNCKAK